MLTIRVFTDDRQRVLDSIRRYRHACREMYGVLLATSAAGAVIADDDKLSLRPDNVRAGAVLAAVMDRAPVTKTKGPRGEGTAYAIAGAGSNLGYDMRSWFLAELMPTANAFVWDSARRDVASVWTSGDPEFPKAKRGWLALQGARGIAQFQRRGIGHPISTAKPALVGRNVRLHWDTAIGPVEFSCEKMDGGRYQVFNKIRDGVWPLGTVYLTERDGELKLNISYERPDAEAVCSDLTMTVTMNTVSPDSFLAMRCGESFDLITGHSIRGLLIRLLRSRVEMERRRAACGAKNRPWGHRNAWRSEQDVLSRLTENRDRIATDYNHAWTRRIASRAASWRCGTVSMTVPEGELFGHPWQWHQFKQFASYKCETNGLRFLENKA